MTGTDRRSGRQAAQEVVDHVGLEFSAPLGLWNCGVGSRSGSGPGMAALVVPGPQCALPCLLFMPPSSWHELVVDPRHSASSSWVPAPACLRSLPFPSATTANPVWEAWTLTLYFGAGAASILLLDSARRSRPSSGPHLADRPHRQTESTLAYDAIPPRVFLEQSRDGIHILDRNGKLRGANRKFEEMLGYSHKEIKNLHVWDWDAQWTREELPGTHRRIRLWRRVSRDPPSPQGRRGHRCRDQRQPSGVEGAITVLLRLSGFF